MKPRQNPGAVGQLNAAVRVLDTDIRGVITEVAWTSEMSKVEEAHVNLGSSCKSQRDGSRTIKPRDTRVDIHPPEIKQSLVIRR